MKAVYDILDALEALDYSDPSTLRKIPSDEIVDVIGSMFSSRHKDIWKNVWRTNLLHLSLDGDATPMAIRGAVSFQFMQMFRSMLLLHAKTILGAKQPRLLYAGPDDEKTRPFCKTRVGNAYTEHQILNWQDLTWDGKIEDGGDIFTDLGGYNCRHYLVPEGYPL